MVASVLLAVPRPRRRQGPFGNRWQSETRMPARRGRPGGHVREAWLVGFGACRGAGPIGGLFLAGLVLVLAGGGRDAVGGDLGLDL